MARLSFTRLTAAGANVFIAVLMVLPAASVRGQTTQTVTAGPLLARQPGLSATQICFTFANDIWLVGRAGGAARRLTSESGTATDCAFSPDGRWVAYTSTRAGNADVWVVPTDGGTPRRLTWHPAADVVRGWTPDGKVLFMSERDGIAGTFALGSPRLFVQAIDDVAPTVVDLPSAWDGAFSPNGRHLAYLPFPTANEIWKGYRGGRTSPIWIADLANASITKVPRENSTDQRPMWVGDTIYFISDRGGRATLHAFDTRSGSVRRLIDNHGFDIKSASAGPGAIVYDQFGAIRLHDLKTGRDVPVPITLGGELVGALPRWVNVSDRLLHPALSPTGARAAFEARGEIVTVPAKKGNARNVTHTPGAAERYPTWSPDGQTLAYFSDVQPGGYRLELRGQTGLGTPRSLVLGGDDTFYYLPRFSPDGRRIAYSNSRGELWVVDVTTGKTTRVDVDPLGPQFSEGIPVSWSADSRWIAYARSISNRLDAVFTYDTQKGETAQLTDGLSDARHPVFDKSGRYLYFVASTDAGPASDFSMMTYDHPITRTLYAIVLRRDLPSPVAPESDEEKAEQDSARATFRSAQDTSKAPAPAPVRIDLDGIDQRTIALPTPPRNYVNVLAGKAGVLVLAEQPLVPVDLVENGPTKLTLHRFDLSERKTEQLLADVTEFDISGNGEQLLYQQGSKWAIVPLAQPIKPGDGVLATSDLQVGTEPRAEWRQMYHEAFRLQRAFFYDPSYHGLDLASTEHTYARYLENLGSREELNYLLAEAFGNLTVGHLFVLSRPGGESRTSPANGLLGADYRAEHGRWRFARVYSGENWNPQFRAPLTQPGVNVTAGEYLLAIDGREITARDAVDRALEGTAGRAIVLRVGPNADGSEARDVTVVPLASETMLRHLAWVDANRRTVAKLSNGTLAYVYVPNTATEGYTRFNRYFFAQQDKQGAIVDERFNSGGDVADYMVEYLARKAPFNYVTARYGADIPIPAGAIYGPKAMLINEYAGSGGDELPWLFRRAGVGPLVGKRTWGGLVGIGSYPTLLDGGIVTAPRMALWTPEGEYAVENRGVAPDVEVDLEPAAWRAGHDTQLERAVAMLMAELTKRRAETANRPAFPKWAMENNPKPQP